MSDDNKPVREKPDREKLKSKNVRLAALLSDVSLKSGETMAKSVSFGVADIAKSRFVCDDCPKLYYAFQVEWNNKNQPICPTHGTELKKVTGTAELPQVNGAPDGE